MAVRAERDHRWLRRVVFNWKQSVAEPGRQQAEGRVAGNEQSSRGLWLVPLRDGAGDGG